MANVAVNSVSAYIVREATTPDKDLPAGAPEGGESPTTGQLWPRGK